MLIYFCMWRFHATFKILIIFSDIFPIIRKLFKCFNIYIWSPFCTFKCIIKRVSTWL